MAAVGCDVAPRWVPADPLRPLLRPELAGCLVTSSRDGWATVQTDYDDEGRPLTVNTTYASGGTAEELYRWEAESVLCFSAHLRTQYGPSGDPEQWSERLQECDALGFPVTRVTYSGVFDVHGNPIPPWSYTEFLANEYYPSGALQWVDYDGPGGRTSTEHTWVDGRLAIAAERDADVHILLSQQLWEWDGPRLLSRTVTHPADDAVGAYTAANTSTEFHWEGTLWTGTSTTRNDEPAVAVRFSYGAADRLPVAWERTSVGVTEPERTTLGFDCP